MFDSYLPTGMPASAFTGATESRTDDTVSCPLCSLDTATQTDIYSHLLVSHRKIAIASALLEASEASE
jgi:hypothetical protein